MLPFTARDIRGTYATLLLPLREDDSIDYDRLQQQLGYYAAAGIDGIYSNGTAGEFFSQSAAEYQKVSRLFADTCSRIGLPYQIGAAWPTPQEALQRVSWAAEFAPSAIQVTLPDWWPPSTAESILYLKRLAAAAGSISLVLYNPPHAKRVLPPAELREVVDAVPQVIGLKTGAGDVGWYASMGSLLTEISVFVPGHTLATGWRLGAAGSYSNVACLQPFGAVRWNRLMDIDADLAQQQEADIQRFMTDAILPFREQHGFSNMALDKLLAWIGNWCDMSLHLSWPYLGISVAQAQGLRQCARERLPFLFDCPGLDQGHQWDAIEPVIAKQP